MPTFDTEISRPKKVQMSHTILMGTGAGMLALGVAIGALALWEAFGGVSTGVRRVEVPGFQELNLETSGMYAGVYQHQGNGPIPIQALTHLDVHIMSKANYQDVPVIMNTTGQIASQLGVLALPVFNFQIDQPGTYILSAVYPQGKSGPTVPLLIFSQAAQNIKQTLFVGAAGFLLFVGLGIYFLLKLDEWAPEPARATSHKVSSPKKPA